jgi:hypothetical protein
VVSRFARISDSQHLNVESLGMSESLADLRTTTRGHHRAIKKIYVKTNHLAAIVLYVYIYIYIYIQLIVERLQYLMFCV